ncbi:MAG TPA: hypothetical protein VGZ73_10030 [Bryobacteraceae bacterium]|nr:hypothetical protein [Bryobacteraceae bacterium]
MTRREFFGTVTAAAFSSVSPAPQIVPVHLVLDSRANPAQIRRFWSRLWPQAAGDFASGGIRLETSVTTGEVRRSPGGRPIFIGLDRGVLNFVVTDQIPMAWDRARALSGVTTRYEGYHLCMAALNFAHCHQIPFLSVNTCLHELLHALLGDIFESRPAGLPGAAREFRVDWYATRLWLFHDGARLRNAAETYVERLRGAVPSRP